MSEEVITKLRQDRDQQHKLAVRSFWIGVVGGVLGIVGLIVGVAALF